MDCISFASSGNDDDSIEIGDFVLVPAGKDNHEAVVEVVNIEYFDEENFSQAIETNEIKHCFRKICEVIRQTIFIVGAWDGTAHQVRNRKMQTGNL